MALDDNISTGFIAPVLEGQQSRWYVTSEGYLTAHFPGNHVEGEGSHLTGTNVDAAAIHATGGHSWYIDPKGNAHLLPNTHIPSEDAFPDVDDIKPFIGPLLPPYQEHQDFLDWYDEEFGVQVEEYDYDDSDEIYHDTVPYLDSPPRIRRAKRIRGLTPTIHRVVPNLEQLDTPLQTTVRTIEEEVPGGAEESKDDPFHTSLEYRMRGGPLRGQGHTRPWGYFLFKDPNMGPGNDITSLEEAQAAGPISVISRTHDIAYSNARSYDDYAAADAAMLKSLMALPPTIKHSMNWKAAYYGIASGVGAIYGSARSAFGI